MPEVSILGYFCAVGLDEDQSLIVSEHAQGGEAVAVFSTEGLLEEFMRDKPEPYRISRVTNPVLFLEEVYGRGLKVIANPRVDGSICYWDEIQPPDDAAGVMRQVVRERRGVEVMR